jgi:hypothetical protein
MRSIPLGSVTVFILLLASSSCYERRDDQHRREKNSVTNQDAVVVFKNRTRRHVDIALCQQICVALNRQGELLQAKGEVLTTKDVSQLIGHADYTNGAELQYVLKEAGVYEKNQPGEEVRFVFELQSNRVGRIGWQSVIH